MSAEHRRRNIRWGTEMYDSDALGMEGLLGNRVTCSANQTRFYLVVSPFLLLLVVLSGCNAENRAHERCVAEVLAIVEEYLESASDNDKGVLFKIGEEELPPSLPSTWEGWGEFKDIVGEGHSKDRAGSIVGGFNTPFLKARRKAEFENGSGRIWVMIWGNSLPENDTQKKERSVAFRSVKIRKAPQTGEADPWRMEFNFTHPDFILD